MTKSQKLNLELSETRQALNEAIEVRNKLPDDQDPDQELIDKIDGLTRKLRNMEVEYRAALVTEGEDENRREQEAPDGEARERYDLLARASLVPFLREATDGTPVTGVELEARAAVFGDETGDGSTVPLDLLLPVEELEIRARLARGLEVRADTVTPVAAAALVDGSQAPVLERIFTRTIAARLGVAMPAVPIGAANYPIMTTGTTAAMAADSAQVDAAAGAFTGFTLEPSRLTAAYLFRTRQTLQLRNFEAVLRRDLTMVMSDAMDDQIINGNGADPNVNGFLKELPAAADPGGVTDWNAYLAVFTDLVDGLNAYQLSDLRTVVSKATFAFAHKLFRTGAADNGPRASAYEYVGGRIGGKSVTSRLPVPDGTKKVSTNIVALTSYPGRNAVAPVWRGMELIRDPYTGAGKGEVRLTAVMYWNFKVLRETGWKLWAIQESAS